MVFASLSFLVFHKKKQETKKQKQKTKQIRQLILHRGILKVVFEQFVITHIIFSKTQLLQISVAVSLTSWS